MSDNITKSPQIRFAGFTDAWEQRELGEVSERVRGNDGRMDLPTLTISAGSGWLDQRERFSGNIAGNEQKNYTLLSKGELSYNHGNSKLAKYGAVFVLRTYEEALVPRVYHSFKTTVEATPDFIEYMFSTKIPDRELAKLISSGARMDGLLNINYDEFMGIKITIPKVEEQRKIAEFVRILDDAITLHQREIELLKDTKMSLLQKMFPKDGSKFPEIRFAGFTDAWEQYELGEVVKIVGGATPSKANKDYWGGDIVWLSSQEIKDRYVSAGTYTITEKAVRESATKVVPAFTPLIVSRSGILARMFPISLPTVDVAINQDIKALFFDSKILDTEFFVSQLEMKEQLILTSIVKTGTTVQSVNMPDFEKLIISIPSIQEQQEIGKTFRDLGNLITLHQRELNLLKNLKKSMLQQMFV